MHYCSILLRACQAVLVLLTRIELVFLLYQSSVLPFNYKSKLAPQTGIEPMTDRLTADCSTAELLRNKFINNYMNNINNYWYQLEKSKCFRHLDFPIKINTSEFPNTIIKAGKRSWKTIPFIPDTETIN